MLPGLGGGIKSIRGPVGVFAISTTLTLSREARRLVNSLWRSQAPAWCSETPGREKG